MGLKEEVIEHLEHCEWSAFLRRAKQFAKAQRDLFYEVADEQAKSLRHALPNWKEVIKKHEEDIGDDDLHPMAQLTFHLLFYKPAPVLVKALDEHDLQKMLLDTDLVQMAGYLTLTPEGFLRLACGMHIDE